MQLSRFSYLVLPSLFLKMLDQIRTVFNLIKDLFCGFERHDYRAVFVVAYQYQSVIAEIDWFYVLKHAIAGCLNKYER